MSDATDYFEDKVLNVLRGTTFTGIGTVYVALFTSATTDAGGGTEVGAGVGYSRQAITFGAPSGGIISNTSSPTFGPNTTTNWGSITHIAIFDASSGGNMLAHKAAVTARTVNVGDSYNIAVGALTLQMQ